MTVASKRIPVWLHVVAIVWGFSFVTNVDNHHCVQAFVLPSLHGIQRTLRTTHLSQSTREDVEQYRASLENLMQQQEQLQETEEGLLLTTTARHRRLLEIELLKSLTKSEDAINELMHLWMYENDASMAQELEDMQDECSPGMKYEENRLREMIQEFPHWAEPRARLALLLYFQGRTQDSYDTALETLVLKPWHFEVYPLLVLLSLRQQNFGQALSWARRSLPTYRTNGKNKRRNEWIRIAVELAQDQLYRAEQRRTCQTEGACLPPMRKKNGLSGGSQGPASSRENPQDDAWQ